MHAISAVLVPLFLLGGAGSMLVVLLTTFQDLQEIFTSDEEQER